MTDVEGQRDHLGKVLVSESGDFGIGPRTVSDDTAFGAVSVFYIVLPAEQPAALTGA